MYQGGGSGQRSRSYHYPDIAEEYGPSQRTHEHEFETDTGFGEFEGRFRGGGEGRAIPGAPAYTTRSRSLNLQGAGGVFPQISSEFENSSSRFRNEGHNRGYGTVGRGPPPQPTARSFSLNPLGAETGRYPTGMRAGETDSVTAKLQAMSVKQDRLEEENKHLKRRTHELEARVAAQDRRPPASTSTRGGVASRGSSVVQKQHDSRRLARGVAVPLSQLDEALVEPNEAPVLPAITDAVDKISVYLGGKVSDLLPEVRHARSALQEEISRTFREVIGVFGLIYPDLGVDRYNETTGELYLNPVFEYTVAHPANHTLMLAVAAQGPRFYPPGLEISNASVEWDRELLVEMARTSFRSCKRQWRGQMDVEVARKAELNRRVNRWRERRNTKCNQLIKGIPTFVAAHNLKPDNVKAGFQLDPKNVEELIHEQLMSDEASGPEDDDTRGKAAWETRMAFKSDLGDLTDAQMATHTFVEVLGTPWRSEEFSADLHELARVAFNTLSDKEKKKIRYIRVRNTGRTSSRIPLISPYDYGINETWFDAHKEHPEHRHLLQDWRKWSDPTGFGANKHMTGVVEEVGGDEADVESNEE